MLLTVLADQGWEEVVILCFRARLFSIQRRIGARGKKFLARYDRCKEVRVLPKYVLRYDYTLVPNLRESFSQKKTQEKQEYEKRNAPHKK